MPYKITKNKDGSFKVTSPNSVRSYHTTRENAERQVRILNALEHNKDFKRKKK